MFKCKQYLSKYFENTPEKYVITIMQHLSLRLKMAQTDIRNKKTCCIISAQTVAFDEYFIVPSFNMYNASIVSGTTTESCTYLIKSIQISIKSVHYQSLDNGRRGIKNKKAAEFISRCHSKITCVDPIIKYTRAQCNEQNRL